MLKATIYIFLSLAAVVAAVVAYASTRPDDFRIARSVVINAPAEKIFPLINDPRKFSTWSPYDKKDPDMKRIYSGPEAGKGAKYEWDGDGNVGKGWFVILRLYSPLEAFFSKQWLPGDIQLVAADALSQQHTR